MDNPVSLRRALLLVAILWLGGLGAAAQFAKIGVPFTLFEQLYPEAGSRIGWLLSLISLVGAMLGMVAGVLVHGFGLRGSLLAGMVLGGAISLAQAGMAGLTPLLASRVVEGMSHLIIVIAAPTLIAHYAPDRYRNFALTLWATFFGVAYALIAWLGMGFVDAHGIPALFRLHGAYMLLIAGALWAVLPRAPRGSPRPPVPTLPEILRAQVRAIRSPWISAPGLGWLSYTLTFVSLLAILPVLIPEHKREAVTGILPLVSICASLILVPPLLGRIQATTVIMAGFAAAGLSALAMLIPSDPTVPAMALFCALGVVQGASIASVAVLNPATADRALANGFLAQIGNLGNLLGTPVLLLVQGMAGQTGLVVAIACFYAFGILSHGWLAARRRRLAA